MRSLSFTDDDFDGQVVDGLESLRQRVVQRLYIWWGTWFIRMRYGTRWTQYILGTPGVDIVSIAQQEITSTILDNDEVTAVENVQVEFVSETRTLKYSADVLSIHGRMSISESIFEPATPVEPAPVVP